jgi:type I restriction enzyme M protein
VVVMNEKFREHLINRGYLEAVIAMPSALFYGTTIGAAVLIVNKKDAHLRENVLVHQCRPRI